MYARSSVSIEGSLCSYRMGWFKWSRYSTQSSMSIQGKGKILWNWTIHKGKWLIYRSKFGDTVDGRNPANQLTWKYLLCLLGFQLRFICTAIIYVCYIYMCIYIHDSKWVSSITGILHYFYIVPSHPRMVDEWQGSYGLEYTSKNLTWNLNKIHPLENELGINLYASEN